MSRTYPNRLIGSMQMTRELMRMRIRSLEHKQKRAVAREGADSATAKRITARIAREQVTLDRVTKRFSRIEERLQERPLEEQPPEVDERSEAAIRGFRDFVTRVASNMPRPSRERRHIAPPAPAEDTPPEPSAPPAKASAPAPAKPSAPAPAKPTGQAHAKAGGSPPAKASAPAKSGKDSADKKKKKKH